MAEHIDDLCLTNRHALMVYFMRKNINEETARLIATDCFLLRTRRDDDYEWRERISKKDVKEALERQVVTLETSLLSLKDELLTMEREHSKMSRTMNELSEELKATTVI